jgi:uncharacterized protein (TIGR03085 family)
MGGMSLSSDERRALADALLEVGPDAATLCEGWTARDLAAHLVARERRPATLPGLVVPVLGAWTEKVRRELASRPLEDLVEQFRSGPPRWSVFGLPGVDAAANFTEHFVHHEDVRRAQPGWEPRNLSERERRALWRVVSERGGTFYRRSPVGVVLVVPEGARKQVRSGTTSVVVTGQPEELMLHAMGRTGHARVDITGPSDAVTQFTGTPLEI